MNKSVLISVLLAVPDAWCSIMASFPFLSVNKMVIGEKCYNGLGCVSLSPEWYNDKSRPYNVFPADRHIINTNFLIWKLNENKIVSELISTPYLTNHNISGSIKLLVHDFASHGYIKWIETLATAFLTNPSKETTVISVDWGPGAEPPYLLAVSNARLVALEIVQFLKISQEELKISPKDVHGIGHGLGAHVLGYVGKLCRLGRITGLDPSGPYFKKMPAQVRLDIEDADFVEVVHTDLVSGGQGIREKLGHVDYYINGINEQPGCLHSGIDVTKILRDNLLPGQILPACSHRRSVKYYIESFVQPKCAFLGFACTSFEEFVQGSCLDCGVDNSMCSKLHPYSDAKPISERGFYMLTSSGAPFCVETLKISIQIDVPNISQNPYVKGYYNVTIPQPKHGDVHFMLNENGFIKTLKTGQEENFVVFRSTPPYLHLPVEAMNLEWNPSTYRLHRIEPSSTRVLALTLFDVRQSKFKFCSKNTENATHHPMDKSSLVVCGIKKYKKPKPPLGAIDENKNITINLLNSESKKKLKSNLNSQTKKSDPKTLTVALEESKYSYLTTIKQTVTPLNVITSSKD